jgi:hypothetical protein
MADGLESASPFVPKVQEAPEPAAYRSRFTLAYVGLGSLLAVALVALGVVLAAGHAKAGPHWSAWQPEGGSRLSEATQIAQHVAPLYHRDSGAQLVLVQAREPVVQNVPLAAVAIRGPSGTDQDIHVESAANAVVYSLCGLGDKCTIPGPASEARGRLMRREALELALYTFRYVDGVDSVVALLPPPKDRDISWSLYFRRSDFTTELSKPLVDTVPAVKRMTPARVVHSADRDTIERLTRPRWFTSEFQQLQDGDAVLVLDPLLASG